MSTKSKHKREGKPDNIESAAIKQVILTGVDSNINSWRKNADEQFRDYKSKNKSNKLYIREKIRELRNNQYSHSRIGIQSNNFIYTKLFHQNQPNSIIEPISLGDENNICSYVASIEINESKTLLNKYPEKLPENTHNKNNLFGFTREGNKLVPVTENPELSK